MTKSAEGGGSEGNELLEAGDEGGSQPRSRSSDRIRLRIMVSGTRPPARMVSAAARPRGVCRWTLCRRRSPEEREEICGKAWISRAAWVPLPTPGGPTRIMRAAR